jgi:uncharacterized surface protein with fasciclin (FAS1) repeats
MAGGLVALIIAGALTLRIRFATTDPRDAAARRLPNSGDVGSLGSILEVARKAGQFSMLASALDRAGLAETLVAGGPYTLFAPSDDAFARLPDGVVDSMLASPETLANILNYHVVRGRVTAAEVAARGRAPTVHGEDLPLSRDGVIRVDGALLVNADIEAANGLIHEIDRVLLPARI